MYDLPFRVTVRVHCILEESEIRHLKHSSISGDVIGPKRASRGICADVDAGEGTKLVSEVRLVVVTTIESEFCPAHFGAGVKLANGTLEALNAAPDLGCEAHSLAKDLGEAAFAPTDLARGLLDAGDRWECIRNCARQIRFRLSAVKTGGRVLLRSARTEIASRHSRRFCGDCNSRKWSRRLNACDPQTSQSATLLLLNK